LNKREIGDDNARGPMPDWLRPWISAAIQRRAEAPPKRYRIFPNMNCEIFVNLARHHVNARLGDPLYPLGLASLFGPKTGVYEHESGPVSDWFLIQLTPLGVRDLLGCPLAELIDADHDIAAVAPQAQPLAETIAEATDFAARLAAVERWALARLDGQSSGERIAALSRLHGAMRQRPNLQVQAMARRLDLGARQLRSIVRAELGMTPKQLLGLSRIEHSWTALYRSGSMTAASDLFADQAHFSREFRRLTGLTPTSYALLKSSGDAILNGFDIALAQKLGLAVAPVPLSAARSP
jgi:AraC-like DNA-binding protein